MHTHQHKLQLLILYSVINSFYLYIHYKQTPLFITSALLVIQLYSPLPASSPPSCSTYLGLTLDKHILEEVVEVLLHLLVGDIGQVAAVGRLGRVLRVHVQVLQHDRLTEGGLVVQAGAALAMTTCADLEVERTVDSGGRGTMLVR